MMNFKRSNKLYIGNLSVRTDQELLMSLLKSVGQVLNVDIVTSDNSRSRRCYAVVEMFNQQDANLVIEKLNGSIFQGRAITVKIKPVWSENTESRKNDQKKFM